MIVGKFFEGDHDMEVAWKQHDVYWDALNIVVQTCKRLTGFAKTLLDTDVRPDWDIVDRYDHRTLQGAHDLLAAAWRFRNDLLQPELPFPKPPPGPFKDLVPDTLENLWLWWLRDEVESWYSSPRLIRYVQTILTNQNKPLGYIAEARLGLALLDRFEDVTWLPHWREGYEKDLENELSKPSPPTLKPAQENKKLEMACECTAKGKPACNTLPCKTMAARAAREGWGPLE